MKKNPFPLFGILAMVGIVISMYQMLWKDISLIIVVGIMSGSTVIAGTFASILYKMGYRGRGGN